MTKADLQDLFHERIDNLTKQQAGDVLESVLGLIKQTLADGENVKISGFGSFVVKEKNARHGRNPQTVVMIWSLANGVW